MQYLLKKYPKLNITEIREKDIIYFLRDALSTYGSKTTKKRDRENYEKEIFEIIKSKEWDWHKTDIDGCNMLCYSLYNRADEISDYLLDYKYDITQYKKDVSHALGALVTLQGFDYFEKIFTNNDIHSNYLVNTYSIAMSRWEHTHNCYYEKYLKVFSKNEKIPFLKEEILKNLINWDEKTITYYLSHTEVSIPMIENVLKENMNTNMKSHIQKHLFTLQLEEDLLKKKSNIKNKI